MAKRRKKTTHHRRRGRVSGTGSHHGIMGTLELVGGLVIGSMGGTVVQRMAHSLNPKIVSLIQIGAGLMIVKHAKGPIMQGAGYGLMSAGSINIAHETGLIHGVEDLVAGVMDDGYAVAPGDMSGMGPNSFISGGMQSNSFIAASNDPGDESGGMELVPPPLG